MAIGVGIGIPFKKRGVSWGTYWINQPEVLFFGLYSEISGGQMPNKIDDGATFLTVAGAPGSETYQCPNTPAYIAADTDYIWFRTDESQRTTSTAELIGYDLQRTPVKYDDNNPHQIRAIMIIDSAMTGDKRDKLFRDFWLPIMWDNSWNDFGHSKDNRSPIEQVLWLGDLPNMPTGVTLTLISGGVRVDWNDESGGTAETEIWANDDGGTYSLLYTIGIGIETKDDICTPVDLRGYKLRAKDGILFSDFTVEKTIVMLGAEEIGNVTFDDASWWVNGGIWSISGGKANFNSASNAILYHSLNWVVGQKYRLKFDLTIITVVTGVTAPLNRPGSTLYNTTGTKINVFTTVDNAYAYITFQGNNFNGSVDNVSLKKVL